MVAGFLNGLLASSRGVTVLLALLRLCTGLSAGGDGGPMGLAAGHGEGGHVVLMMAYHMHEE